MSRNFYMRAKTIQVSADAWPAWIEIEGGSGGGAGRIRISHEEAVLLRDFLTIILNRTQMPLGEKRQDEDEAGPLG